MITEDFVNIETVKLLKEKGFNEKTHFYYHKGFNELQHCFELCFDNDFDKNNEELSKRNDGINYSASTLQMTMKWLREVHNIHIVLHPYTGEKGHNWTFIFDKYTYGCWQELGIYITDSWSSYEEACEAAIKYCLTNLI